MADVMGIVQSSVASATGAIGILDDLSSRIQRARDRNLSAQALLRAYYFEVVNDLEFLDLVDFPKIEGLPANATEIRFVVSNIRTDMALSLLFKDEAASKELIALMGQKGRIGRADDDADADYENVLQAVSFTVMKTEILRRLSVLSDGEIALLKPVQAWKRAQNIRSRFRAVKAKLDGMASLRKLAR
jgi:hypothetical protein